MKELQEEIDRLNKEIAIDKKNEEIEAIEEEKEEVEKTYEEMVWTHMKVWGLYINSKKDEVYMIKTENDFIMMLNQNKIKVIFGDVNQILVF